jgi:hypothetical protein
MSNREVMQQALEFLMTRRLGAEAVINALNTALAQPEQQAEPIGFINSPGPITQYIIPTQRPWVGLTDEDKKKIATVAGCTEDDDGHIVTEIFRLAEAKLKERNGY